LNGLSGTYFTSLIETFEFYYGWWIVIACSIIGLLSGSSRFSFTMFFPTLIDDLGWTRAMLGFGLTLHMWVYAFSVKRPVSPSP